jgi:hypothetical protein
MPVSWWYFPARCAYAGNTGTAAGIPVVIVIQPLLRHPQHRQLAARLPRPSGPTGIALRLGIRPDLAQIGVHRRLGR